MVYNDQTAPFRALIAEGSKSPPSHSSSSSRHQSPNRARARQQPPDDGFLKDAYQIYGHLADLGRMLKTIRKPYLSTAEPPPMSRRSRANGTEDDLKRYEGSKFLSERERDEIEVRAKMILRRCRERVGMLEDAEKARKERVAPAQPALFKYLPSLAPPSLDTEEPLIAAHRAGVIWTLSHMLAKLSAVQTDMQEERAKRRDERNRTLGGGAAREAAAIQIQAEAGGSRFMPTAIPAAALTITPGDEPPIEEQLSSQQLQQLESENSALLEHMESQLSSVLSAEKSLLEISAMQTELVRHLVQQTEMIDQLYDEAVGSVAEMGKANTQLKKAKERSGEARFFLLMFLIGASLALLFLNWYA